MKKPENLKIKNINGYWCDLSRWLIKGSAGIDSKWFYRDATAKTWQRAIKDRLPFIKAVRDHFNYEVTRGTAESSVNSGISAMNVFMKWVDGNDIKLHKDDKNLEAAFLAFDEYYYLRAWGKKEITPRSAYSTVFTVSQCISKILERPVHAQLKYQSRTLKSYKHPRKTSISRSAEKQHLGDARAFGYYCIDIADAITIESVYGQLPITANTLRPDGSKKVIKIPSGLVDNLKSEHKNVSRIAETLCKPTSHIRHHRKALIKIRLLAELVIFVYQTGINVSQAIQIERKSFSYKLQGNNDWVVTCHKGRKQGPVSFTIYKEYRERFKKLIKFVDHFYSKNHQLFPLSSKSSKKRGTVNYRVLKHHTTRDGIPWVPLKIARNTRANFLDRMTGDPNLSAEMSQHTKEVFLQNYKKPSQQRSMAALTDFWKKAPISLINSGCEAKPEPTSDKPSSVINPNCTNESGCLWCKSHRDINSEDYVWSLATFRHLKLIEANQPIMREIPADLIIERLSDKLKAFEERNEQSQKWVKEARMRIEESFYHPTWVNIINFWESR